MLEKRVREPMRKLSLQYEDGVVHHWLAVGLGCVALGLFVVKLLS